MSNKENAILVLFVAIIIGLMSCDIVKAEEVQDPKILKLVLGMSLQEVKGIASHDYHYTLRMTRDFSNSESERLEVTFEAEMEVYNHTNLPQAFTVLVVDNKVESIFLYLEKGVSKKIVNAWIRENKKAYGDMPFSAFKLVEDQLDGDTFYVIKITHVVVDTSYDRFCPWWETYTIQETMISNEVLCTKIIPLHLK